MGLAILALLTGQIAGLITAPIYLVGGIGIARRRVWSAYGLALFEAAGLLDLLVPKVRGALSFSESQVIAWAILSAALAVLFFVGGRSLAAVGGKKGYGVPWIVLTGLNAVVAVLLVFLQPFNIPSGSMEATLLAGDSILVRRPTSPVMKRGEIIVFRYPLDKRQMSIKRVVAVSGDRIKIVQKQLFLNGKALQEPYAVFETPYFDSYRDNFPNIPLGIGLPPAALEMLRNHVLGGEVVVPAGSYFVLGDNRDASLDSRYWGFVHEEDVYGRPLMIYWSREPKHNPAFSGNENGGSIRWNRLFKLI